VPDARIAEVCAWEALDSRGRPTVGCEVTLRGGASGTVTVPSGASTGSHEALELRDGDPARYGGWGVLAAVGHAEGELADAVRGLDGRAWRDVDAALEAAAGGDDLGRCGANATLAVSLATVLAAAANEGVPPYTLLGEGQAPELPLPMVNIISGGAHAGDLIDIQDCLAIPVGARSFGDAIRWAGTVRNATQQVAEQRGMRARLVADEGGLGLPLQSNEAALELLVAGIDAAGLRPGIDVAIGIDVAATQLATRDGYGLPSEGRALTSRELVAELQRWVRHYPVVSIEDGLGEDDWPAWRQLTDLLGATTQLIGDDLFVTNAMRIERGVAEGVANAVLIKPNQAGTLSRTFNAFSAARGAGYRTIVSARSGDTEDSWLADLVVAWRAGPIKVGSTTPSERNAKWNRHLQLERRLPNAPLSEPFGRRP